MFRPATTSLLAMAILCAAGVGAAAQDGADGLWSGIMRQVDVGSEHSYGMTLRLSGAKGESDYPLLHCGGRLDRIALFKEYTVYSETVTRQRYDPATGRGCIDGVIVVRRSGPSLILQWSGVFEGMPSVATAVLSADGVSADAGRLTPLG